MEINIYSDYQSLSRETAAIIIEVVRRKAGSVLCLAAGDTPRLTYEILAQAVADGIVDFSRCTFVALDEWVGISPETEGTCAFFLQERLFRPMHIDPSHVFLFDAMARNLRRECEKMNAIIRSKGGIDLMLVGVGMNGHIGFNEPGSSADSEAHVVALDETTRRVGQKYFRQTTELRHGITLGLKQMMESTKAILMASGRKKSAIIKQALEGPLTEEVPASLMRRHSGGVVMLDEDAASQLGSTGI